MKTAQLESITTNQLDHVTGGRLLIGGAQGGGFQPGVFPRLRQVAQGTFIQNRQAGLAARMGGCPNGQCGG